MPNGQGWKAWVEGAKKRIGDQQTAADMKDINQYRDYLGKATYADLGGQFSQGLGSIQNYLAGAGPLADSGAGAGLKARLASSIYSQANNRIQGGVSDLVGNIIKQRRDLQNQMALMKYQKKLQGTGFGGVAGGVIGGIAGSAMGPIGTAIGSKIGAGIGGGGGGYYSSLSDYYGNLYGAPK